MLQDAVVHLEIMGSLGINENKISYYDLLITAMHYLGRYSTLGFIPAAVEFGLTPLAKENNIEKEILIATKKFINFWIEYRYIGYDKLIENLEYLDGVAWDISGDLMQFRFTTRSKLGELPHAYFYVLDKKLMRENFVKKS